MTTTDTTAPDPAPAAAFCPRGCTDGDDCRASLAIPCARNMWDLGETGSFQACGCLTRSRCGGCSHCENCDGCYCGED